MQGEQTSLRAFGGGVDPSAVDPDDGDEVRTRKRFVATGGDQTDLGVRLERDLVERLDPKLLETGKERHRLHMHPQRAAWADAMYIRAQPTDENRKFDRTVMQLKGYPTVGMPRAWLRNDIVNGIDNPFHNAGREDYVVIRYLPEGAIEIYTAGVYNASQRFVRIRAVAPLIMLFSEGSDDVDCYNVAASTPYDGQMFEIVPFDWEVFAQYFRDRIGKGSVISQRNRPTQDEFSRIMAAGGVTPCISPSVRIFWFTESAPQATTPALSLEDTGRFRVIFPEHGHFRLATHRLYDDQRSSVSTRTDQPLFYRSFGQRIRDWIARDNRFDGTNITRINKRWWGRFHDVPEDGPPIIYIPTIPE